MTRESRFAVGGALTAALLLATAAPAVARPAVAGPFAFDPLDTSATCGAEPMNAPFELPSGYRQAVFETEASDADFDDLPDMNQLNETGRQAGRYLFRTHEVSRNGSISRTDLRTGETTLLAQRADWERFDGLKWTPWRTLLAAEEVITASIRDPQFPAAESGLLYEVDPWTGEAVARPAVGSVSHEGIGIDPRGDIYVIDEFAHGAIFRFVPDRRGDLSSGQLYALKITNDAAAPEDKTGTATWIPLDRQQVQINARTAALAAGATTYGRPEDVEIFRNVLYVAVTSEDRVLAIDLKGPSPFVTEYVGAGLNVPVEVDDENVNGETDEVTGFNGPDNLAVDKAGNLYVAEDNSPGDIWVATPDRDRDGTADEVHLFASLTDCEAEPTGIYFGKDPFTLYVNVQHAGDGNDKAMVIQRDRGRR